MKPWHVIAFLLGAFVALVSVLVFRSDPPECELVEVELVAHRPGDMWTASAMTVELEDGTRLQRFGKGTLGSVGDRFKVKVCDGEVTW